MSEEKNKQAKGEEEVKKEPAANSQPKAQPQPTNMEVHKHPHHVMHKKKWGEYFLEFLMIFLAVTLGFFAETFREHSTEHKRAREFAVALLKDLQQDTAQLNSYKEYFSDAANNIDTLMQLLAVADPKNLSTGKLYKYGLWGGARRFFIPNDATFQQMKSSGSLRYFKKNIAGDVARYDRWCRLMQNIEEKQQGIYVEVRKIRAQLFDFRYNDIVNNIEQERRRTGNYSKVDSFMKTNPPLLNFDKTLFNQYIELVRSRFLRNNISAADSLLHSASELIKVLREEYKIEND